MPRHSRTARARKRLDSPRQQPVTPGEHCVSSLWPVNDAGCHPAPCDAMTVRRVPRKVTHV